MTLVKCWEYYFNSTVRRYDKRKFAINVCDITCFFEYDSEREYRKKVLRVFLSNGAYHDIDMTYKELCDIVETKNGDTE